MELRSITASMLFTALIAAWAMSGCTDEEGLSLPEGLQQNPFNNDSPNNDSPNNDSPNNDSPNNDSPNNDVVIEGPLRATVTHSFGNRTLDPFAERSPCVSWTLNNDEPLYVEKVTLSNGGGYHHSNWFVVPEEIYPGEDGFWRCNTRDFEEISAAVQGTVLFAQSTQSLVEEQSFGTGIVIKIPPRSKIVANVHLLNLAPREHVTELRMSLDIAHPSEVKTLVTPFRLSYLDLDIPPMSTAHFTGECKLDSPYQRIAKRDYDIKLYWVLPHFHQLGNHFKLEVMGGDRDGEVLYELESFNADANGKRFDTPVDLTGTEGLRFTCGYTNPTRRSVGWGIGNQEMCVMLGFMEGGAMLDASVVNQNEVVDERDGIVYNEGPCVAFGLPRSDGQTMPQGEELTAPLYIPSHDGDTGLAPVPECEDTPADAVAEEPVTLESVEASLFAAGCAFSACHNADSPAAGLALVGEGLHDTLLSHPGRGHDDLPLVAPGDPEGSWLYQIVSRCEPTNHNGEVVSNMPLNSPTLLDPGLVAKLRDWIANGAQDN